MDPHGSKGQRIVGAFFEGGRLWDWSTFDCVYFLFHVKPPH